MPLVVKSNTTYTFITLHVLESPPPSNSWKLSRITRIPFNFTNNNSCHHNRLHGNWPYWRHYRVILCFWIFNIIKNFSLRDMIHHGSLNYIYGYFNLIRFHAKSSYHSDSNLHPRDNLYVILTNMTKRAICMQS